MSDGNFLAETRLWVYAQYLSAKLDRDEFGMTLWDSNLKDLDSMVKRSKIQPKFGRKPRRVPNVQKVRHSTQVGMGQW